MCTLWQNVQILKARKQKKTEESGPLDVAIMKFDVVRNEDGASAVLSWRHSRFVVFRCDSLKRPSGLGCRSSVTHNSYLRAVATIYFSIRCTPCQNVEIELMTFAATVLYNKSFQRDDLRESKHYKNRQTEGVKSVDFKIGDIVLKRTTRKVGRKGGKLQPQRNGPLR